MPEFEEQQRKSNRKTMAKFEETLEENCRRSKSKCRSVEVEEQ